MKQVFAGLETLGYYEIKQIGSLKYY